MVERAALIAFIFALGTFDAWITILVVLRPASVLSFIARKVPVSGLNERLMNAAVRIPPYAFLAPRETWQSLREKAVVIQKSLLEYCCVFASSEAP
jgi:hypothetical protein